MMDDIFEFTLGRHKCRGRLPQKIIQCFAVRKNMSVAQFFTYYNQKLKRRGVSCDYLLSDLIKSGEVKRREIIRGEMGLMTHGIMRKNAKMN